MDKDLNFQVLISGTKKKRRFRSKKKSQNEPSEQQHLTCSSHLRFNVCTSERSSAYPPNYKQAQNISFFFSAVPSLISQRCLFATTATAIFYSLSLLSQTKSAYCVNLVFNFSIRRHRSVQVR